MNARHLFAAACFLALGIAIGQISPSAGQQAAPQPAAAIGRYQIAVASGAVNVPYVCDTTTGECWRHSDFTGGWTTIGTPIDKAKAAAK